MTDTRSIVRLPKNRLKIRRYAVHGAEPTLLQDAHSANIALSGTAQRFGPKGTIVVPW